MCGQFTQTVRGRDRAKGIPLLNITKWQNPRKTATTFKWVSEWRQSIIFQLTNVPQCQGLACARSPQGRWRGSKDDDNDDYLPVWMCAHEHEFTCVCVIVPSAELRFIRKNFDQGREVNAIIYRFALCSFLRFWPKRAHRHTYTNKAHSKVNEEGSCTICLVLWMVHPLRSRRNGARKLWKISWALNHWMEGTFAVHFFRPPTL